MEWIIKKQTKNPYITGFEWSSIKMLLAKGGKHGSKTFKEIFWLIIGWSLSYTDTRVPPRNTSLKIKAQYISHAKRFHYVKWVLPALVYPRVEMDQLKEKVLSRTINKGSEEDIFLYLKPSEDSTQKCHWRSKVISILWTKSISVSRRVLYKKKIAENPNTKWQYPKQSWIHSSSGTPELEMVANKWG